MQVDISVDVQIREQRAEIAWLRNRSLIQAQAIEDLKKQLAEAKAPAETEAAEWVDTETSEEIA